MKDQIAARLKQARRTAGFHTAGEAAEALGVEYPTYAAHENGSRKFDLETAALYARRYRVSLDWLISGRGEGPEMIVTVRVMGYLGAGAEVEPDYEQVPEDGLEKVEVPFALPDDLIAFKVRGDSMLPQYKPETIIIVYNEQQRALDTFFGEEAAVRTTDGRRFIKTIMKGYRPGHVTLTSWNASPIENVHLEWIGEIFGTVQPRAVRKVARQGGIQGQLRLRA